MEILFRAVWMYHTGEKIMGRKSTWVLIGGWLSVAGVALLVLRRTTVRTGTASREVSPIPRKNPGSIPEEKTNLKGQVIVKHPQTLKIIIFPFFLPLTWFRDSFDTLRGRFWGSCHGESREGEIGHSTVVLTGSQAWEVHIGRNLLAPNCTALQEHNSSSIFHIKCRATKPIQRSLYLT